MIQVNEEFDFERLNIDDIVFGMIQTIEDVDHDNNMSHLKRNIYHDCISVQLDKKQDFSRRGKGKDTFGNEAEFDYIVVMDGHGDPEYFDKYFGCIVDNMDFPELLGTEDPVKSIVKFIDSYSCPLIRICGINPLLQVGSTLSIAKIYNNTNNNDNKIKVVCYNIGDSRIAIYKNGNRVYINKPHTIELPQERARLADKIRDGTVTINDGHNYKLINNNMITKCANDRAIFKYGTYLYTDLVPTQCLGHLGITGLDPEIYIEEFANTDNIRVIVYSDGVDDMICDDLKDDIDFMAMYNCDEIIEKTEKRWKSNWILLTEDPDNNAEGEGEEKATGKDEGKDEAKGKDEAEAEEKCVVMPKIKRAKKYTTSFAKGDDCSVGIWDNYYYDCLL
jgi:serine/threonine protein phosphatase PrpC